MEIHYIDTVDAFNTLRGDWEAVYEADPDAQFFLSWQWLSDWFNVYWSVSFVLAAKRNETDAEYVAFMPMRMKTVFDKKRGFSNEIFFAGADLSDYTGILTRPEFEAEAVAAFADYVKRKLNWARFKMDNLLMSDKRRRLLLNGFGKTRFAQTPITYKDDTGAPTNHAVCPSVALPARWDDYLQTLSTNNRQKIRRHLRKVDAATDYRITESDAGNFDQNLTMLLDFWKIKWTPSKGDMTTGYTRTCHMMLTRCAANGSLFLPVFWHGDRPVVAHAILIDAAKKSLLFFITGRDETYRELPAGFLLHAYCIRYAIAHGFTSYDFLRGDEPYKYQFAPQERRLRGLFVTTKTKQNLGGKLDPKGLPAMIEMTLDFEKNGELADAELGYRQILELEPNHALALFRFGRLMAKKGVHGAAKDLLSRSVAVEPEGDNAWFWLAQSLQSLGDDAAALEAYRRVVKLQPQNEEAKRLVLQLSSTAERAATVRPTKSAKGSRAPRPSPVDTAAIDPNAEALQRVVKASKRVRIIGAGVTDPQY